MRLQRGTPQEQEAYGVALSSFVTLLLLSLCQCFGDPVGQVTAPPPVPTVLPTLPAEPVPTP